jgi:16S rRNA (cytidine1402-2'-O)-methyltransferase
MTAPNAAGKLYLVATPIGNLGDITLRALETLRGVALVLAEDTRRTRALLTHFEIKKTVLHFDAHASPAAIAKLVERLLLGEDAALVTDAGTPSVSDPGAALVSAAHGAGVVVIPIPGVSAVTTAIAVAGLGDGPFTFLGFPARGGKKRVEFLARVVSSTEPVVLFESPHRIERTLLDLAELAPDRPAVLCRELTKLHEEISRGSLAELSTIAVDLRGELTLVIQAAEPTVASRTEPGDYDAEIRALLAAGETPRDIVAVLSDRSGGARRELYRRVTELAQDQAPGSER